MQPFATPTMLRASAIAFFMAFRGMKRKSLTASGAVAAWIVGFLSISCGLRGFLLLLFYLVATKATKHKISLKSKMDQTAADSSCRGPSQVLACSALGVVLQLFHVVNYGEELPINFHAYPVPSSLACALIAHHATSLGDTLASELGILSKSQPVLITTLKQVPRGTNGGITFMGFVFSALGGLIIGIGAIIFDTFSGLPVDYFSYINFGTAMGLVGSVIDSILGATVQVTYFDKDKKVISIQENGRVNAIHISGRDILSNAQVNVVSILLTSVIGALLGPFIFR